MGVNRGEGGEKGGQKQVNYIDPFLGRFGVHYFCPMWFTMNRNEGKERTKRLEARIEKKKLQSKLMNGPNKM